MNGGRWVKAGQLSVYALYLAYGLVAASSVELPLFAVEGLQLPYQVHRLWNGFTFEGLVRLPQHWGEMGAVIQYLFMAPFLAVAGENWFAFRLAALPWNLLGLVALAGAFDDRRTALRVTALAAFGSAYVTEVYLYPYGGYSALLLPFGLLMWLARRFFARAADLTFTEAFRYGLAVTLLPVLSVAIGPAVVAAAGFAHVRLTAAERRRLLPGLALGAALGSAIFLGLLWWQHRPASNMDLVNLHAYPLRLWYFVAEDLPDFFSLRGLPWSGPFFVLALLGAVACTLRERGRDPVVMLALVLAVTGPLWLHATGRHVPGLPGPELLRLRHFAIFWPAFAVILGAAGAASPDDGAVRRWRGRFFQWTAGAMTLAGVILTFGQTDRAKLGFTRTMPLETLTGRLISEAFDPLAYETPEKLLASVEAIPPALKAEAAFFFSIDTVLHLPVWGYGTEIGEAGPSAGGAPDYEAKTGVRRRWLDPALVPVEVAEPYWTGAGFFACEGSLRFAAEAEADLDRLKDVLPEALRPLIDRGCELGVRWRRREIAYRRLQWPLEPELEPIPSGHVFVSRVERFRTKPFGWIRLPL